MAEPVEWQRSDTVQKDTRTGTFPYPEQTSGGRRSRTFIFLRFHIGFILFLMEIELTDCPDSQKTTYDQHDGKPWVVRPVNDRRHMAVEKSDQYCAPPPHLRDGGREHHPEQENPRYDILFFTLLQFFLNEMEGNSINTDHCDKGQLEIG